MPPVIRIIGRSGSGKTTLLARIVRALADDGVRVAVMKHAHHHVDLDRRGKDSFRFAEAGAVHVTVVSRERLASFHAIADEEPSLEDLARGVEGDADLVLAEGFHDSDAPYFLLLDAQGRGDRRPLQGELLGVISADGRADGAAFDRGDAVAIIERIRGHLGERAKEHEFARLLAEARAFHGHVCPGQILGVRLAMLGCREAGVTEPRMSRKLITWVEIDRCGADAVQTVTGCKLGKRTLKFVDNGKLAATFLNTETGVAVRVAARADSRERAAAMYPALGRHEAQARAYGELPDEALFSVSRVAVVLGDLDRPGKPAVRVQCVSCGEEVNDGRHVQGDDGPVCRACTGGAYYRMLPAEQPSRGRP